MKHTRQEVYAVIDGERDYQDAGHGNAARHTNSKEVSEGRMSPGEFLLCMEKALHDAREAWYRGTVGGILCLDSVRKVAALGVQCMEVHGAPVR